MYPRASFPIAQTRRRPPGNLDERLEFSLNSAGQFLELNEAIERLKEWDERKYRVTELRYFAGMDREEIAEVLDVLLRTLKRDLAIGEAFVRRELTGEGRRA